MPRETPAGPAGYAAWERREIWAGEGRPLRLLALPDASNPKLLSEGSSPVRYIILERPRLARGPSGAPAFSVIVGLRRQPRPGEDPDALIDRGTLTFEATLKPPPQTRDAFVRLAGGSCQTIFADGGQFRLVAMDAAGSASLGVPSDGNAGAGDGRVLAEMPVGGSALSAALSTSLSGAETLEVLAAVRTGSSSRFIVRAEISFRAVSPALTLHLAGVWAEIARCAGRALRRA